MPMSACDVMQQASLLAAQTVLDRDGADGDQKEMKARKVAQQKYRCAVQDSASVSEDDSAAQSELGWGGWSISAATREEDTSSEWVGKNICRHWAKGYCNRGQNCHFSHAGPSPNRVLCPDAGAPLVVNSSGGSLPTDDELKRGDKFIVVKSTLPCKDYAAGECFRGDLCRFAHIGAGACCPSSSYAGSGSSRGSECDSQTDAHHEAVSTPPRHNRTCQVIPNQHSPHQAAPPSTPQTIVIVSAPPSYPQPQPPVHAGVRTVRYVYSTPQQHVRPVTYEYAPVEHCVYPEQYEHYPPPPPPVHITGPPPEVIYGYRGPTEHAIPGYGVGHGA